MDEADRLHILHLSHARQGLTSALGLKVLMVEGALVVRAAGRDVEQRLGEDLAAVLGHRNLARLLDPLLVIPDHDARPSLHHRMPELTGLYIGKSNGAVIGVQGA